MKNEVQIVEVGPRDGLQNEATPLGTEDKLKFIENLIDAGVKRMEVTSFVNPKAIPQMADSEELYRKIVKKGLDQKAELSCLVPNRKGYEIALDLKVKEIAVFTSTSEAFNSKNIKTSLKGAQERFCEFVPEAIKKGMKVRGYLSTVFGCPYEGEVPVSKTIEQVQKLFELGCYEVSLGDTIGIATPVKVIDWMKALKGEFDLSKIAMHFHDTRGLALTNIYTAYLNGIRVFDSSAGGIGGCPYAKGATGNVATEDVLYLFHSLGVDYGNIEFEKLIRGSDIIFNKIKKKSPSKFREAFVNKGYKI
ncbi:MAG: hydroxymethylglutaryl-CoA lyase [Halobacteriovoraceae bacterium]|nr:hydroxymethylglutaryl-CoA lyase [Halobacteriovoraceae bacterium]MCB9093850.1 hydroxymethylglutaryl-CoA lyase [Halobacteriovoraceae bacterium]